MAIPRKTRGEYRPVYEALFHGRDYRALSPSAKLCLLTLKGLCGAAGIRSWPGLMPALAELTGLDQDAVGGAILELRSYHWVEYEDGVVWVVRGLEFEPQLTPNNALHRKSLRAACDGLPSAPIVERFEAHYRDYFTEPGEPSESPSKPFRDPMPIQPQPQPLPYPSLTPTPTPTLSPDSTIEPVDVSNGQHRVRLSVAANKGITKILGHEHTRPIRWDARSTYAAAELLAGAGVDVAFAEHAIYGLAQSKLPEDGKPPESLRYFTAAVVRLWDAEQAHRLAATSPDPGSGHGDAGKPPAVPFPNARPMSDAEAEADLLRRVRAGEFDREATG